MLLNLGEQRLNQTTETMDNLTYLLGAGASYHAMPVQNELIADVARVLENLRINNPVHAMNIWGIAGIMNGGKYKSLMAKWQEIVQKCQGELTIDTYARTLHIREEHDQLLALKKLIDFYFHVRQFDERLYLQQDIRRGYQPNYGMQTETTPKLRTLERHDRRYTQLLASLIRPEEKRRNDLLPPGLSVLTYNYDLQLEEALAKIFDIELRQIVRPGVEPANIVHLNGRAAAYHLEPRGDGRHEPDVIGNLLDGNQRDTEIGYAWDKRHLESSRFDEIVTQTKTLVVIGYSFPQFNQETDKEIVNAPNLERIIIQDVPGMADGLVRKVDSMIDPARREVGGKPYKGSGPIIRVSAQTDVTQFHVPV